MHDDPADLLRRHGLHVTAQRLAVLRAVGARPHATAAEVVELAATDIGAISRQAVYDVLTVLVDKALLRRIEPTGSPARYERRVADNHHHLICRICGQVTDVDCAVGSAPCLQPSDALGYDVEEAEVIYWGHCPDCRTQKRSTSAT